MQKSLSITIILCVSLPSFAYADGNRMDIAQASVGTDAPTVNFTQAGTGAYAAVTQTGNDTVTGVQSGVATKLTVFQDNTTGGTANTIGYTGRGNSDVTVYQRADNGTFVAPGSAGNTANIDVAGNAISGGMGNKLVLNQIGFNNSAIVYDTYAGSVANPSLADNLNAIQFSDNLAAGNQLQIVSGGVLSTNILQKGGNKANISASGGTAGLFLIQDNTADNAISANVANITLQHNGLQWSQTGTGNDLEANLNGVGLYPGVAGWQTGRNNLATITEIAASQDRLANVNTLVQIGNNDNAAVTQNGTLDSIFYLSQTGDGNSMIVIQSGAHDLAQVTQTGNGNASQVLQSGTSAIARLSQLGNNNFSQITQSGTSNAIITQH